MYRSHHLIAICIAIVGLGLIPATATAGTTTNEDASPVAVFEETIGGQTVEITEIADLQPFTHVAYIAVGADLSSIKIEGIKLVKVATKRRSLMDLYYCDQTRSEPGGSIFCPRITNESPVPAYQVTYSFRGQPMASDEYGNTYFTFAIYFRPDELSPELRRALSSGKLTTAAEYFDLTTSRNSIRQLPIDQANSTLCDGNYVDGNWVHTNPKCDDRIAYTTVESASPYITVKVDPARSRIEEAAAGTGPLQK